MGGASSFFGGRMLSIQIVCAHGSSSGKTYAPIFPGAMGNDAAGEAQFALVSAFPHARAVRKHPRLSWKNEAREKKMHFFLAKSWLFE
jgi:hypothetical protein